MGSASIRRTSGTSDACDARRHRQTTAKRFRAAAQCGRPQRQDGAAATRTEGRTPAKEGA